MVNLLSLQHLTKTFGGLTAVKDVSFTVEKGRDCRVDWAKRGW
jgi:ABC-type branched-subunit amino acid transport system ATPase component